ncbi:MAG: hypothetical protein IPF99_19885 [Deltaproteobacteria bacterium]|nr:hypothetical protein [Deltaproteobacteria bacterium]
MAETTRAHKEVDSALDGQAHREFMRALLNDVRALERMLAEGTFESGQRRIGAEQEMFLIDRAWSPARGAVAMLEKLEDPHYTTELGQFQLEVNGDPQPFAGDGLATCRRSSTAPVRGRRGAANDLGMDAGARGHPPHPAQGRPGPRRDGAQPRYLAMNRR